MSLASLAKSGRNLIVVGLIAGSVTGCDDPFSPYWDRGTYDLTYANNRRVPAVVVAGPGTAYTEVTGGSLALRRDHSYQLVVDVRERLDGQTFTYSKVFAGEYENEDRTLYLDYVDSRGFIATIVANWRDGRIELVVPRVNGYDSVLCEFSE